MKRIFVLVCAMLMALSASFASAASITYGVNRTVGNGTVTGTIETDGTLGVLTSSNITDWTLTLTSPNLSGSPALISRATQAQTNLQGSTTFATPSQLLFDFTSQAGGFFLLQGGTVQHFYCLEVNSNCSGFGDGERIGFVAETSLHTGIVAFASVAAPVPEPEVYAMMLAGLGLVTWLARRKKSFV